MNVDANAGLAQPLYICPNKLYVYECVRVCGNAKMVKRNSSTVNIISVAKKKEKKCTKKNCDNQAENRSRFTL